MEVYIPEETDFEKRIRPTLSQLRPNSFPTACFELAGSPYAGKSTAISLLDDFFRCYGFSVYCPQEGAQKIRHVSRKTPLYNLRTGIDALITLIDAVNINHTYDIVILDRGLIDAYCWMCYWQKCGKITSQELAMFRSFYFSRFCLLTKATYILTADPHVALTRKKQNTLTKKLRTQSPETIAAFIQICKSVCEDTDDAPIKPYHIDATHLDKRCVAELIAENMITTLLKS